MNQKVIRKRLQEISYVHTGDDKKDLNTVMTMINNLIEEMQT